MELLLLLLEILIVGCGIIYYLGVDGLKDLIYGPMEFTIDKIEIYDEDGLYDVIPNWTYKLVKKINKDYIKMWYKIKFGREINEESNNWDSIRLKMYYTFRREQYICYFPYKTDVKEGWKMPLITEKDMELYRQDIIEPFYGMGQSKKYYLYSLFMMDSRDVSEIIYNEEKMMDKSLKRYMRMIGGPRHDFGILMDMPIKLKWIYEENWEVFRDYFRNIKVKFMAMYLDETLMELKEHVFESDDLEDYFITEYMEQKMIEKNKECGREFKFINTKRK